MEQGLHLSRSSERLQYEIEHCVAAPLSIRGNFLDLCASSGLSGATHATDFLWAVVLFMLLVIRNIEKVHSTYNKTFSCELFLL